MLRLVIPSSDERLLILGMSGFASPSPLPSAACYGKIVNTFFANGLCSRLVQSKIYFPITTLVNIFYLLNVR